MFSVSTVLGDKASKVEVTRPPKWSSLQEQVPSFLAIDHHHIGQEDNKGVMFGELRVLLFVLGVCMGGWEQMYE